jgi:hypothetical protein
VRLGRNDPCHCGSGKKYKHCHLPIEEAPRPGDITWRRVQAATADLATPLLRAATSHFGPTGLDEAWAEFNVWYDEEDVFDPDSPYLPLFMPWFFHNWLPDVPDTDVPEAAHETTAAQAYVRSAGKRLDPLVKRYIEACGEGRFSFYEVLACEPGRGFRLRDVILGTEADVLERSASRSACVGDLLFGKVVRIEDIAMLDGCGPVFLPPKDKVDVLALRNKMAPQGDLSGEALHDWEFELRELYLSLGDRILYPEMPAMANTDGEPLEFHTLAFDIASAREAFDALKDLAEDQSEQTLLEGATFDTDGALVRVEIPWIRVDDAKADTLPNVALGTIRIDGTRLTAEVNSAARAKRLTGLVRERLGDHARERPAEVRSLDSMFAAAKAPDKNKAAREREENQARLAETPEVQALMNDMMRRHYRAWVDDNIPALGDRTPREAVKDAGGREAVEALVRQIERDGPSMRPPLDPAIVRELRETLGL